MLQSIVKVLNFYLIMFDKVSSSKYDFFRNIWHTFNSDHLETALDRKIKQKTGIFSVL